MTTSETGTPETGDGDGDPGGDGDGDTGDPTECSQTSVCVDSAPDGWYGPGAVVVAPAGMSTSCGGDFLDSVLDLAGNFNVEDSVCACDCEVSGASCPTSGTLQIWDNAGCNGNPDFSIALAANNPCFSITSNLPLVLTDEDNLSSPLENDWFSMTPSAILGGTCDATPTATLGAAGFANNYALCGPTEAPNPCAVSDGVCVPVPQSPFEAGLCVWQVGDFDCPAGAYTHKTLLFGDAADTRTCGACDCGTPQGECSPSIALDEYNDGECVNWFDITPASCMASGAMDVERATFHAGTPSATCSGPGTSALMGEAEPIDPVTICCTQ